MDVDASFATFVSGRWSMLYRLATLLVGAHAADELTQAALVRAYVSWAELQGTGQVDERVKWLLAATAVRESGRWPGAAVVEHPGPVETADAGSGSSARDRARTAVGALLPRQRAQLVLRHYEGLSDLDIAHALGCPPDTVTADLLALEAGADVAALREELERSANEAVIPIPEVAVLIARGREARRRRVRRGIGWTAGAAALALAALAASSLISDRLSGPDTQSPAASAEAAPRFLSQLAEGASPRISYAEGRRLHLGDGRQVSVDEQPSAIVQTKKWLYLAELSGAIVRVDLATGQARTVAVDSQGELVTDPSGEHVAWLASGNGSAVVTVETVADDAVLLSDRQQFPATPRCCDNPFVVNGMTQGGEIVASLPAADRAWVWTTPDGGGDRVREIGGIGNGVVTDVTARGVVVSYPSSRYAVGTVSGGLFVPAASLVATQADFGDPLGLRVVYADEEGELHVRDLRSRGRSRRGTSDVRLQLPAIPEGFTDARWEDPDHVLLDLTDPSLPHGALVRCAVLTGACQLSVRFDGPHLLAR